ncbi:HD domain-containing protein [Flavihumibacter rivuli]|uniref:HD domain-containing protein n=1 Tax=Flavihumibacter rivuli TaxID=2838156 RepID=UPI001BDE5D2B|nr:HD domain-containing protein [Flavihumibacter rivuli]ULQ57013.1 HD domain-containing protein [Flavihumibacter rivuli]
MTSSQLIAQKIIRLFNAQGAAEYAGERVSQLEHMVQAASLAKAEGYDDEVVLAAFLHDIGHLLHPEGNAGMDGYGTMDHEKVGAEYLLSLGFGKRMCRLIASHVDAKRYLTYADPAYYDQLSEASKRTLEFQGGRMGPEEANVFESDPYFDLYICMRKWDEAAKVENLPMPDWLEYETMIENYLDKRNGAY